MKILSFVLLLTKYTFTWVLRDALRTLQAVLLVFWLVSTVTHMLFSTTETSYQTSRPSIESFVEEEELKALWAKGFETANCWKVDTHEDELIDEMMGNWVLHEESSSDPHMDDMTRSEVANVMEDNIKAVVEVPTTGFVNEMKKK